MKSPRDEGLPEGAAPVFPSFDALMNLRVPENLP
jgi:hypothetical protein